MAARLLLVLLLAWSSASAIAEYEYEYEYEYESVGLGEYEGLYEYEYEDNDTATTLAPTSLVFESTRAPTSSPTHGPTPSPTNAPTVALEETSEYEYESKVGPTNPPSSAQVIAFADPLPCKEFKVFHLDGENGKHEVFDGFHRVPNNYDGCFVFVPTDTDSRVKGKIWVNFADDRDRVVVYSATGFHEPSNTFDELVRQRMIKVRDGNMEKYEKSSVTAEKGILIIRLDVNGKTRSKGFRLVYWQESKS